MCLGLAFPPALAGEAVVTAQGDDAVDVIDLDAGTILRKIPVAGSPAGVALSPDRRTAYVTRPDGPGVAVIDLPSRSVVQMLALPGGPLGIAVNPRTGAVYVADWYASRLFVLVPGEAGLRLDGEIAVGASPSGIAVTPDGATLLVANREANSVSLVDAATRRETRVVAVGQHPFGITIDPQGQRAYTANVTGDDVSVIDLAQAREVGRVRTGTRPYVVALAGGRGFVTDQYSGTVTAFDLATLQPVGRVEVGDHPEGIAASADGRALYVANWGSNTLSVIDAAALKVTRAIRTDDGPRAFGDFLR
ncbi:beta-propeller fold lactonase family protein [uncultured Methylobacterium sp.]|uniref:beta-propeller fold lactonase family protein n=1 Tax=uncultured Methylobacterium sp. TaxID=157278 RepID=UPI0035C96E07